MCRPRRQPCSQHWTALKNMAAEGRSNQLLYAALPVAQHGKMPSAQTTLTNETQLDNHQVCLRCSNTHPAASAPVQAPRTSSMFLRFFEYSLPSPSFILPLKRRRNPHHKTATRPKGIRGKSSSRTSPRHFQQPPVGSHQALSQPNLRSLSKLKTDGLAIVPKDRLLACDSLKVPMD